MKILLTGFAGGIGRHLTNALLQENHTITGVDNLSGSEFDAVNTNVHQYFINDFNSKPILNLIAKQSFDTVIHLAAKPRVAYSVEHPAETNKNNVQDTVELLEACKGNVGRFVFASSSSVYGGATILPTPNIYLKDPKSPYALQKSIIEDYMKMFSLLYGMDTVALRYFNVFGSKFPGDSPYATAISSWIHKIKNGLPLRSDGDGTQSRDLCHVDNVVSANILAMNSKYNFKGECYNVACGTTTSNNEILAYLRKKFPHIEVVHAPFRMGDVHTTHADISDTEHALGYKVVTPFWDGVEKTVKDELGC
jgi:nucleoside-diphosphate-sugar epimerase